MMEVGTRSLLTKVHPEKKPQSKNSTVIDRKLDPISITVVFYRPPEFFFMRTFVSKLLLANLVKATVLQYSSTIL